MPMGLVTGCAGFIGSHLTEELLNNNWEVVGIDNFHPYYSRKLKELNLENAKKSKNFQFIEGSILSDDDLDRLPKVDCLYHFAAIAGVRNSILNPQEYFQINVEGTRKLLGKFKDGTEKIVFASTSSVYGEVAAADFPVKEDHPLNPISTYGQTKKEAEKICLQHSKETNTKLVMLRFYTVYGPRQRPDEAFTKFIRLAQEKKPIPIYGDGNKERDFTYVSDIVSGTILAAKRGQGTYNLGSGRPVTVNEMVSLLEKHLGTKLDREYVDSPPGDVQKTHSDISKAKKEMGYEPKMPLDEGIKNCIKWCSETKKYL